MTELLFPCYIYNTCFLLLRVTVFALLPKTASAQKRRANLGVCQEICPTKALTFTSLVHEISQNTVVCGYYAGKKH